MATTSHAVQPKAASPVADGPVVCTEHLSKRFGDLAAVDDLSFTLERGLVPSIGVYTPVGASAALVADPTDYVLAAAACGLLLLGYVTAFVLAGSLLVARRDVT
jgi:hypothetical protein